MLKDMCIGGPAQMRLAKHIVWTCFHHLLALLLPSSCVRRTYDKLAVSLLRGPQGWMNPTIARKLGQLGFKSVAPTLDEVSLRSRLLTLNRRQWLRIQELYKLARASVFHEDNPLVPELQRWFESSALKALCEASDLALDHGFFRLDDVNCLTFVPSFRVALLKKGALSKMLCKIFQEGGSHHEGLRLLRAWLDRRIRGVFGDYWPSYTRLSQIIRSLKYVGQYCPPRVLNALLHVLIDGVVLSCEGETYPFCLLNQHCGGANSMSHYAYSLCWQNSLSRYNADTPFLHNLLRPPGIHTRHLGWKAFWLVKAINAPELFQALFRQIWSRMC